MLEGNKLYVTGNKPDAPKRVQELLKTVEGGNSISDPLQLRVYTVKKADPDAALLAVTTMLAGIPGARASKDPKTGSLIVLARPKDHLAVRNVLEQLEVAARTNEVFKLQTVDPELAVSAINKLFAKELGANPPKVRADSANKQLFVRGSDTQIQQIKALLERMGERFDTNKVDDLFSRFDKNKDGKLTKDEVPAAVWQRISKADANHDGAVTEEELRAFRKKAQEMKKEPVK